MVTGLEPGAELTAEVAVRADAQAGAALPVLATASFAGRTAAQAAHLTVAEPGWIMWMVSHFHYDPVWWSTQGQFTESRLLLPDEDGEMPEVRTAFELVRLHLDAGPARPRLQVRAGRDRLPQAALRRAPRGPRGPARLHQGGPDRARRRQLQRAEHEPDLRRVHYPQRRLRHRLPARRTRRRPAHLLDAGCVRLRSRLSRHHGRGRAHQLVLGARPVPPVGAEPVGRRQPADAVRRPSSSGSRPTAPACSPATWPITTARAGC